MKVERSFGSIPVAPTPGSHLCCPVFELLPCAGVFRQAWRRARSVSVGERLRLGVQALDHGGPQGQCRGPQRRHAEEPLRPVLYHSLECGAEIT